MTAPPAPEVERRVVAAVPAGLLIDGAWSCATGGRTIPAERIDHCG